MGELLDRELCRGINQGMVGWLDAWMGMGGGFDG